MWKKDEEHNARDRRRKWTTTLRFNISETTNSQRGKSVINTIEILEGSPESAERAFEVMAEYDESKFSFLRGFQMWALSGMWNKNSKTYNEDLDIQPPMPDSLGPFLSTDLKSAQFPGMDSIKVNTVEEGRRMTEIVTLTFWAPKKIWASIDKQDT